jgi:hypothetical protein
MKFIALSLATLIGVHLAADAPVVRHQSDKPKETYAAPYDSRPHVLPSEPFHRGPIYHGYPLTDWYVY